MPKLQTVAMWMKAQRDYKTYRAGDVFYNRNRGFYYGDGNDWLPIELLHLDSFMRKDGWEAIDKNRISKSAAEKILGMTIVDE